MNHKRGYPRSRRPHSCFCNGKWAKAVTHEPKPSVQRRMPRLPGERPARHEPLEDWE